jgi:hypothetical protein
VEVGVAFSEGEGTEEEDEVDFSVKTRRGGRTGFE